MVMLPWQRYVEDLKSAFAVAQNIRLELSKRRKRIVESDEKPVAVVWCGDPGDTRDFAKELTRLFAPDLPLNGKSELPVLVDITTGVPTVVERVTDDVRELIPGFWNEAVIQQLESGELVLVLFSVDEPDEDFFVQDGHLAQLARRYPEASLVFAFPARYWNEWQRLASAVVPAKRTVAVFHGGPMRKGFQWLQAAAVLLQRYVGPLGIKRVGVFGLRQLLPERLREPIALVSLAALIAIAYLSKDGAVGPSPPTPTPSVAVGVTFTITFTVTCGDNRTHELMEGEVLDLWIHSAVLIEPTAALTGATAARGTVTGIPGDEGQFAYSPGGTGPDYISFVLHPGAVGTAVRTVLVPVSVLPTREGLCER